MKNRFLFTLFSLIIFLGCSKDNSENNDNTLNKNNNRETVGFSANDLLSDATFKSMIIEVVYVEGFEPSQATIANFVSFLTDRTFKPNGILVEKRAIPSRGNDVYSIATIADIERELRQNYNSEDQIAVWVLFTDGRSDQDSSTNSVLGTAYWNTSFVIFEETIQELSNSTFEPDRTLLETTVINHEFGHILGLTDLGSPMVEDHEDLAHPKHCDVETCLMFWAIESSAGIDAMVNMSSVPQLDVQCIADLRANGGK
jgi:hypothetical protein